MPTSGPRVCATPGCGLSATDRFCDQCRTVGTSARGTACERGYDRRWRNASKRFLIEHPLCAACEAQGRVTAAAVVDHIEPHRGDPELFWDPDNWQGLCTPCHNRKTAQGR